MRSLDAYGTLVDRFLFPAWEGGLQRRATIRYQRMLSRTERSSADELCHLQTEKLGRLLRHVGDHVPYYRERFREVGFEPGDFRSLEDLATLPILTRDIAQRTVTDRTSTAPPFVRWRAETGGTLGSFLAFGYDTDTESWRQAGKLRAWGWAGYRVGAPTLYYVGVNHGLHPPPGQRLRVGLERLLKRESYFGCMVRNEANLKLSVELLRKRRPRVIICYPSAGADLARYVSEHGLRDWPDIAILCHGEKVFDKDRSAMEMAFGPNVFETYACREVFMVASECEFHDGLHMTVENVLVEVIVRGAEGVRPAAPGEVGEVVLTDLNNLGMPFIRYSVGDVAAAPRSGACACGRTLPRLHSIEGRTVETLRGNDDERISSTLFEQVLMNTLGSATSQFQIVQHRDRSITLRIVPARGFEPNGVDRLLRECRAMVPGVPVAVDVVDGLPPERTGKRRVVIVEGG